MKKICNILITMFLFIAITLLTNLNVLADDGVSNYLTSEKQNEIEEFVQQNMAKGKIPGLMVTIVKDDKTIYEKGFGYSNIEKKESVTKKTLFELGSTSKAFTALGILKLEKEGLININDCVNKYIPWFEATYEGEKQSITIEQLMHHSSGIPFRSIEKIPVSAEKDALEETIKTLVGIELDSKPGEKYQYATINYDVLGLIIQNVSLMSYEDYIQKNVLEPMGLNNTYMQEDDNVKRNKAVGYKINFLNAHKYDAPIYKGNTPAGYIITNGEDIAKWLKIQMKTSQTSDFDDSLIEKSHVPNRTIAPYYDGSSYALGWNVYQDLAATISHGGSNPNYSSFILFKDNTKEGVAVLSNTNSAYVDYICQGISEILEGKSFYDDIKDINKIFDIVSVCIIGIFSIIITTAIYLLVKLVKELMQKKRKYEVITKAKIFKLFISLAFTILVSYCVYLLPYILYDGVSWTFVFVWLPKSVKFALYSFYVGLWISWIYMVLNSAFKKKCDKSLPLVVLLSIASGFGNALIIFVINMAINSSNDTKLKLIIYFILGAFLYVYGQKIVRKKLICMTNNIVYEKRIDIIEKVLKAPFDKFQNIDKGRIQATLNNDTETISRFVNILIGGVTSGVTLICCCIYLGFINKYALLLAIVIIIFISAIYYVTSIYADRISQVARGLQNIFLNFINDLIDGNKELSLNEMKKQEFKTDLELSCNEYRIKRGQASIAFADMFVIGELLFTFAIGIIVLIFPFILTNLKSSSIASYVFVLLYMIGPVHQILDTIPGIIEVRISSNRINELINELSCFKNNKCPQIYKVEIDNVVLQLHDVEYEYDSDRNFRIGPINYKFKSGEIVFISGGNGSGKSTLGRILTGLYTPTNGYISLNDKPIKAKDLSSYYTAIFSDFHLFNKLYGINCDEKRHEIEKYLELLQLNEKVKIENGKFSTINLSTGQKKRLALLVAFLEDKPIYFFDEWAADQDPEYRSFFYNTILINLKKRGKCIIAVTHDDQYFDIADKLIKMNMGQI